MARFVALLLGPAFNVGAQFRGRSWLMYIRDRHQPSGGPFDFVGTDKKASGNFPGLADLVVG